MFGQTEAPLQAGRCALEVSFNVQTTLSGLRFELPPMSSVEPPVLVLAPVPSPAPALETSPAPADKAVFDVSH